MQFNLRETATVLAALRMWQADVTQSKQFPEVPVDFADIALEAGPPLTAEEIDVLCMRINTDYVAEPLVIVSGGTVQNYAAGCGFDLLDYDNLRGQGEYPPQEWTDLSEQARKHVREHDPDIAAEFEPPEKKKARKRAGSHRPDRPGRTTGVRT